MSDRKPLVLPENNSALNQAALEWLKQEKADLAPAYLHVLSLALWGLENGVEGEWPRRDRPALELQVGYLLGWKAVDALEWLVSNPDGPDHEEQQTDLLLAVEAQSAQRAASLVLGIIYSRMQSVLPALQPAAS